ncbi:F0F1 ATP synthase subunit epsilon [uncultured Agitococcus sp.]|uniref:FoF1 ATP synthase subunit delta/epsilon n=1 Tax=uncultured Agitococcus sp. TaxID=1506599 RepID=UPI0026203A5E|nr:F0F1 ATP synthase subunit epsilon [uncultured Agitococcus sp.]
MPTFNLRIETPNGIMFNETVQSVLIHNELGDMEVFAGHAPLIASILFSRTKIRVNDEREEQFLMRSGIITVDNNSVKILVEHCALAQEVNYETIKDYEKFVISKLSNPAALGKIQLTYLQEERSSLERMVKIEEK